jgi:hypothetical protein
MPRPGGLGFERVASGIGELTQWMDKIAGNDWAVPATMLAEAAEL